VAEYRQQLGVMGATEEGKVRGTLLY